jgi:hypothetical protein
MDKLVSSIGTIVSFDSRSKTGVLKLASGVKTRFSLEQEGIHKRALFSAGMTVNYQLDKRSGRVVGLSPDSKD